MSHQQFTVGVAAEEAVVRSRLNEVANEPSEVVGWFTSDANVQATVTPSGDLWLLAVEGGVFRAKGTIELRPRVPGSLLSVTVDLKGKGLLGLFSPALALASGKIEGEVRTALYREFGEA